MPSRQPTASRVRSRGNAGAILQRYCGAVAVGAGFFTAGFVVVAGLAAVGFGAVAPAFAIVM